MATPLVVNEKLIKEDEEKKVDGSLYRSLVSNLLHLTATRPDIMYVVSLFSRFMNNPSQNHFGAAKRVLRYIRGTTSYGIKYCKDSNVKLFDFCDNDWGDCTDDMKSTSRYAFSLGFGVFSWASKKQQSVTQSSVEAEYVSAGLATSQEIWEAIEEGEVELKFCRLDEQIADIFTKALYKEKFQHFRELLRVMEQHIRGEQC
ncbi:uncharacterized protein LOC114269068 [Camellia sinensis]|uniref:uncharacterized protein LOC114269068 n=1 Tax=Camellia sinensis TaxID=4442 RepID=UPI001036573E|nr:uncharacterized protein LOC114269068 [Camellia sinensis]